MTAKKGFHPLILSFQQKATDFTKQITNQIFFILNHSNIFTLEIFFSTKLFSISSISVALIDPLLKIDARDRPPPWLINYCICIILIWHQIISMVGKPCTNFFTCKNIELRLICHILILKHIVFNISDPACADGWREMDESSCVRSFISSTKWYLARKFCEDEGANLLDYSESRWQFFRGKIC